MMKILFILTLVLMATGCVSATVADPSVCDSQNVSWQLPVSQLQSFTQDVPASDLSSCSLTQVVPPVMQTVSFDFSSSLSKVSDVTSALSVKVNQLTLGNSQGLLGWVQNVSVQITSEGMPSMQLASYTMPDGGSSDELSPVVQIDPNLLLSYLENGPVTLSITISGTVNVCQAVSLINAGGEVSADVNVCVGVSGHFNKSL
jgi:hypothetical protein